MKIFISIQSRFAGAALALGAMAATGGAGPLHATYAQPHQVARTYIDAKYGLSLRYPATWAVSVDRDLAPGWSNLAHQAIEFVSPDMNANAGVLVHAGTMSTASIKATETALLQRLLPIRTITYWTKRINGLPYSLADTWIITDSQEHQADFFVAATSHRHHTYFLVGDATVPGHGYPPVPVATFKKHIAEVAGMLLSLTIQ